MPSVTETCRCGATMTYEGVSPRSAADEFRVAHKVCREIGATPQVKIMPLAFQNPQKP